MARARLKPIEIVAKKYGRFIHEVVTPKESFPPGTKFRYVVTDSHRVLIGYWGKPIHGKHPYYRIQKILHPKKRGEPCNLKDRLKLKGVKELVLGRMYGVKGKLPKLTGRRRGGKLVSNLIPNLIHNIVVARPSMKVYVGILKRTGLPEVFKSGVIPTEKTHGRRYSHVIGPFRSIEEAHRFKTFSRTM